MASGLEACREEVMGFMRPVEALTQAQVCLVHSSSNSLLGALGSSQSARISSLLTP